MKRALFSIAIALSVFSCGGKVEPSPVDQVEFSIVTPSVELYRDSGSGTVLFTSNTAWTAATDETWLSVLTPSGAGSPDVQEVTFSVAPNAADSDRSGLISLMAGDRYETVLVTQTARSKDAISEDFRRIYAAGFSHVYICAHRANTYSGTYVTQDCPENSIPAIGRCIASGLDMVELDIRKTSDGVLVCSHDPDISSVTVGSGAIASLTYDQIASYDMRIRETGTVAPGVHMPRLQDALEACKGKIRVNLDLAKTTIPAAMVLRVVEEAGMMDEVTLYTGSDGELAKQYYELSKGRVSVHLSIGKASDIGQLSGMVTVPLFQLNYKNYDGTSGTTALSSGIRQAGYCSFSNLLNHDSAVRKGDTSMLERFCNARIDFLQTDIGDHPNVQNLLSSKGLR